MRKSLIAALAVIIATGIAWGGEEKTEKLPIPEPAKVNAAIALVKEVYGKELASEDAKVRKELAGKLMKQAEDPGNDDATSYVLLMFSATSAAKAGDVPTTKDAVGKLEELYDGAKTGRILLNALEASGKAAKEPEEYAAVAEDYLDLIRKGIRDDDFATVKEAASKARAAASRAKNKELSDRVRDAGRMANDAERQYKAVEAAFVTLTNAPDDAKANLAVGRYLCLIKREWDKGLKHLEKGADKELAKTAKADLGCKVWLENGADVGLEARMGVADQYYDFGQKEKEDSVERNSFLARARVYYEKALPELGGLMKTKVEKRMEEVIEKTDNKDTKDDKEKTITKDTIVGKWMVSTNDGWNGTYVFSNANVMSNDWVGKWEIKNNSIIIRIKNEIKEIYVYKQNMFIGHDTHNTKILYMKKEEN